MNGEPLFFQDAKLFFKTVMAKSSNKYIFFWEGAIGITHIEVIEEFVKQDCVIKSISGTLWGACWSV